MENPWAFPLTLMTELNAAVKILIFLHFDFVNESFNKHAYSEKLNKGYTMVKKKVNRAYFSAVILKA